MTKQKIILLALNTTVLAQNIIVFSLNTTVFVLNTTVFVLNTTVFAQNITVFSQNTTKFSQKCCCIWELEGTAHFGLCPSLFWPLAKIFLCPSGKNLEFYNKFIIQLEKIQYPVKKIQYPVRTNTISS